LSERGAEHHSNRSLRERERLSDPRPTLAAGRPPPQRNDV